METGIRCVTRTIVSWNDVVGFGEPMKCRALTDLILRLELVQSKSANHNQRYRDGTSNIYP